MSALARTLTGFGITIAGLFVVPFVVQFLLLLADTRRENVEIVGWIVFGATLVVGVLLTVRWANRAPSP